MPVDGAAAPFAAFYPLCASCHATAERSPPNFLAGPPERVVANVKHCAPRIYARLALWGAAPAARDKTPMPPAFPSARGEAYEPAPAIAGLERTASELVRAESGAAPRLDLLLADGYERLRPCLPGVNGDDAVTPQSAVHGDGAGRARPRARLRELLETMNSKPGVADPANAVLPFGQFERLHFARLACSTTRPIGDIEAHGVPRPSLPRLPGVHRDCDGPASECLADLARRAGPGCAGSSRTATASTRRATCSAWMLAHERPVAANYVNWVGRTVRQVQEESALRQALAAKVPRAPLASGAQAQRSGAS